MDYTFTRMCAVFEEQFFTYLATPIVKAADAACKPHILQTIQSFVRILGAAPVVVCGDVGDVQDTHNDMIYRCVQVGRTLLACASSRVDLLLEGVLVPHGGERRHRRREHVAFMPLVKGLGFWKAEHIECRKQGAAHVETVAEAGELLDILSVASDPVEQLSVWQVLVEKLPMVTSWVGRVRQGAVFRLLGAVVQLVDSCASAAAQLPPPFEDLAGAETVVQTL